MNTGTQGKETMILRDRNGNKEEFLSDMLGHWGLSYNNYMPTLLYKWIVALSKMDRQWFLWVFL